jgi:hypothetical protein
VYKFSCPRCGGVDFWPVRVDDDARCPDCGSIRRAIYISDSEYAEETAPTEGDILRARISSRISPSGQRRII